MTFTVSFEFVIYMWIMEPSKYQTWKLDQCITGIRRETRQRIITVQCNRGIYLCLFIFYYKALHAWVKERTCLRIAIPAYCFVVGALFCVFKNLIIWSKTIWQTLKEYPWAVWRVRTFLVRTKKKHFFLENSTLVWSEFL